MLELCFLQDRKSKLLLTFLDLFNGECSHGAADRLGIIPQCRVTILSDQKPLELLFDPPVSQPDHSACLDAWCSFTVTHSYGNELCTW